MGISLPSLSPAQASTRSLGKRVGGAALGVVQRKHARPPRPGVVELGEQFGEGQRAPVLV